MDSLFWGYFSRISNIASSLVIMPFALTSMSVEYFSIWMIFIVFFGLIQVFDFGCVSTFSRQLNYVMAGATKISTDSPCTLSTNEKNLNKELFTGLLNASRLSFYTLTAISFILLTLSYFYFILPLEKQLEAPLYLEWLLYSSAIVIGVFCLYYNSLFLGLNITASLYRVYSFINITFFFIAIILLILGEGLLGIAIARFISAVVQLIFCKIELKKSNLRKYQQTMHKVSTRDVLIKVLPNAYRLGLVNLGEFLTVRGSVFLVAIYLPLELSGKYALALNIITVISSIAYLYMTIKTPNLNMYRQTAPAAMLIKQQNKIYLFCLMAYFIMSSAFILLGPTIIALINSNTLLPSIFILLLLLINGLLECIRNISMNFIASKNTIPFVYPILSTGIIILSSTYIAFELGYVFMITPIIITLLAQCTFNNWFWPFQELKERQRLSA